MALSFCAYGAPVVPGASDPVVIVGAAFAVSPQAKEAVWFFESLTWSVNGVEPATATPDNNPLELIDSHVGKPLADQE